MSVLILPTESPVYQRFNHLVDNHRMVFMAGVPGVGKSLLVQQLAVLADKKQRPIHLLQWDVSRAAFEIESIISKYPEIDGFTHIVIRKAVGLWARGAIARWYSSAPTNHFLIAEIPLVGNRLIELVQKQDDEAESFLTASLNVAFITSVPSREVRSHIEIARAKSIANPANERERFDAQPNVLRENWVQLHYAARQLNLLNGNDQDVHIYDPGIYGAVFSRLMHHRPHELLPITTILKPTNSAYDLPPVVSELAATPGEAERFINTVEQTYSDLSILQNEIDQWWNT